MDEEIIRSEVEIPEGEIRLQGTTFIPKEVKGKIPAVLYIHGWKSKQDTNFELAERLAKQNVFGLAFNLREHGVKDGDPMKISRAEYMNDVKAAYDFLVKQECVDSENITLMGSSMGSYLAMILSEEKKAQKLILRVPANYLDDGFDEPGIKGSSVPEVAKWRNNKAGWEETKSLRALHSFPGEVLIVESELDEDIPHQTIQNYADAIKNEAHLTYKVMLGATHSIKKDEKFRRDFNEIVENWMFHK